MLVFSLMIFGLLCHCLACCWIFAAQMSYEHDETYESNKKKHQINDGDPLAEIVETNWIIDGEFTDYTHE